MRNINPRGCIESSQHKCSQHCLANLPLHHSDTDQSADAWSRNWRASNSDCCQKQNVCQLGIWTGFTSSQAQLSARRKRCRLQADGRIYKRYLQGSRSEAELLLENPLCFQHLKSKVQNDNHHLPANQTLPQATSYPISKKSLLSPHVACSQTRLRRLIALPGSTTNLKTVRLSPFTKTEALESTNGLLQALAP